MKSAATAAALLVACAPAPRAPPGLAQPRGPLPAPLSVAGELDGWHVLGDFPKRAQRLGAGEPALVASGPALDNDWLGGFVDVPRDDCLLVYARAGASIADVDVAIYSEDGASLAVDEGRDVHPTVVLCPPHPARVYVAGHVAEGEGLVAVGAQLVPKERSVIVARGLGARGTVGPGSRPGDGWPGLTDTVRAHRLELGGQWEELRRLALTVDARLPTYAAMPIDAERCVDALVVPDDDVAGLDVEVLDSDGRAVARSQEGPGPRSLTVCSPIAIAGTLSVRPHSGRGLAAVVLARADAEAFSDLQARPDVAWVTPRQSIGDAKKALEALLSGGGYGTSVISTSGSLTLARKVVVALDAKAVDGACSRIDVVAGEPLALIDARLWSDHSTLLDSEPSPASTTLFACNAGPARLELEARGRPGPYAVTVRPERWKDPALLRYPLAAARMLARSFALPRRVQDGKEHSVRALPIDAERAVSWTESIPPGKCLRVAVGVQGEGAGVGLRVFDESESEVDRAEAPGAVRVRACALASQARAVRIELRASAGKMDAIVGERLE